MITKKYYKLVKVSYEDSGYFYMENISDQAGNFSVYKSGATQWTNAEYSTDGVNWEFYDLTTLPSILIPSGGRIYIRGNGRFGDNYTDTSYCSLRLDVDHIIGGNIYSLIDKTTFSTRTTSVNSKELLGAFMDNTHLISAAKLNFGNVSTLNSQSFFNMFSGCTSLTTPPTSLPATTLASSCYKNMFSGCTSLTTAPELPATTLASSCYTQMFDGCTSLTTAPELPATTLANGCYLGMFNNCSSLTAAPTLPATAMAASCYSYMFKNCSSLNTVKCLATDISANNCTNTWLGGVSATGTFIKSANMSSWTTGTSGIPSGWTVVDA